VVRLSQSATASNPTSRWGAALTRCPVELPQGPGGFSPKVDLIYNTGFGNGPMGMGWVASVPYVERNRNSPFLPQGEIEYSLSGARDVSARERRCVCAFHRADFTTVSLRRHSMDFNSSEPGGDAIRFNGGKPRRRCC
jgi:hypothetical protein